jgi:5-methylcytosine-specific restriction endonuclease McrA
MKRKSISGKTRLLIWERSKKRCQLCGKKTVLFRVDAKFFSGNRLAHIDHITPLNRAGVDSIENMRLLCEGCNCQKRDRLDEEYKEYLCKLK